MSNEIIVPKSDQNPHTVIQITKFIWNRTRQKDTIDFLPGFNLIADRSQQERTDILRLIRYAMGGSHSRIEEEITQDTESVELWLSINGRELYTKRAFIHPDGKFVFSLATNEQQQLSPRDAGEVLLDLAGIPKIRYQRGDSKVLLSFNDLARAFVIDRDFSYTEILSKMDPEPRREVVKILLGLTTQAIAVATETIRDLERQIQKLGDEVRSIERFLGDFQIGSLIEITSRRNALNEELEAIQEQEDLLRNRVSSAAIEETRTLKTASAEEYSVLRTDFLATRERLSVIENELGVLNKQIQNKNDLRFILTGEQEKLDRHQASEYVLSSFTFSKCPRCSRPIEAEMRRREQKDVPECMLCGRVLEQDLGFDISAWDKASADSYKAIEEVDQLLEFYQLRIGELNTERDSLTAHSNQAEAQLTQQTAKYVSPLFEEISLLNARRSQILQALSSIDLEERQRNHVNNLHDERLPKLKRDIENAEELLQELVNERGNPTNRINGFLKHYIAFMRQCATAEFKSAEWHESDMLPLVNGQPHTQALNGPNLALAVLGFHYALVALKIIPEQFDTTHPGLLIIDEPFQQKMEVVQYDAAMKHLTSLATENESSVQIIVAATETRNLEIYRRSIQVIKKA